MNINESLRDWIASKQSNFPTLTGVDLLTMGETADKEPPFLGIYETGADQHEAGGVTMRGVSDFQITCELHTVPASDIEEGTSPEDERLMRRDLYDIIGDEAAIAWMEGRNGWRVFDIRMASPTTEAGEGRRISRWVLSVIACPI